MSGSEQVLYAGSNASAKQPGIFEFSFDSTTGELRERSSIAGIENPSYLVLHPKGPWMYAVSETDSANGMAGSVWAFNISEQHSQMGPVNKQPSGGDSPCHLAIDGTGRWLVVSNYGSGSVGVLQILSDGSLGKTSDFAQHQGSGPNPERQEGPHAHSAIFSPDNRFLIVADLGIDALMVYRFDAESGKISPHEQARTRPGVGPRHMAWHPEKPLLYVANELESSIAVYEYERAEGHLREVQVASTLPDGAPENLVADIHVDPAGNRVYVSNRGHNSIAVFDIQADGTLNRIAISPCGGNWPRAFALAPGGRFMVAANERSGQVAVLPIQAETGAIGAAVAVVNVPQASIVQFREVVNRE